MDGGELTLCLKCRDLARSERFSETLGLEAIERTEVRVLMKNGNTRLALMTFLPQNCLNFRGADPVEVYAAFQRAGFETAEAPERYAAEKYGATADGTCWSTSDPDGNSVFIDTNEVETSAAGRRARISRLLNDTQRDLERLGASADCLEAFRSEIIDRFTEPGHP